MNLILFNFVRGFATSLEMEATAEADTGVTAGKWMDGQMPTLEALLADRDVPAFRAVLDSFEPDGFDLDLDELFESGLSYLLDGFQRSALYRRRPKHLSQRSCGECERGNYAREMLGWRGRSRLRRARRPTPQDQDHHPNRRQLPQPRAVAAHRARYGYRLHLDDGEQPTV